MSILTYLRNKTTPYILAAGLSVISLIGCKETRTELSDIIHEDAKVTSKYHRNSFYQPIIIGKMVTGYPRSEINKITFDGLVDFEVDNKEIYSKFKEGDIADISYRESYELTFEDLDKDGIKEQTEKIFTGYEFVDAQ
jgi:hypothetical protein